MFKSLKIDSFDEIFKSIQFLPDRKLSNVNKKAGLKSNVCFKNNLICCFENKFR
jgi:hypothetical protein